MKIYLWLPTRSKINSRYGHFQKNNSFFDLNPALLFLVSTFFIFIGFFFIISSISAAIAEENVSQLTHKDGWVYMPEGAKPAYMGIHGGTMPISLVVSQDGSALLSFVGKTGNDFLNVLTNSTFAIPSFGNSTLTPKNISKTDLFAGNSTTALPVFSTNGIAEEWLDTLAPFGFSVVPLAIEGQPDIPPASPKSRRYRNFYLPGSLLINKK